MFSDLWKRVTNWWRRININPALLKETDSLTNVNVRTDCEKILTELKEVFEQSGYDPKVANTIRIKTTKTDFIELTKQLKGINTTLHNQQHISSMQCEGSLTETSLDDLFVSKDRTYIPWTQINSFIDEALKLCTLTRGYEQAEYGPEEHNFRMLSTVFYSTRNVSSALLQACFKMY